MSYKEWKEKYITLEEDNFIDKVRHKRKEGKLERKKGIKTKVTYFTDLPKEYRITFRSKLTGSDPDVKAIILKELDKIDFFISTDRGSYYDSYIDVIKINLTKPPSTLAHEIFHKIDSKYGYIRKI